MKAQDGGFAHISRYMGCSILNQLTGMKDEEWVLLERNSRSLSRACLANLLLLDTSKEKTVGTF